MKPSAYQDTVHARSQSKKIKDSKATRNRKYYEAGGRGVAIIIIISKRQKAAQIQSVHLDGDRSRTETPRLDSVLLRMDIHISTLKKKRQRGLEPDKIPRNTGSRAQRTVGSPGGAGPHH